MDRTPEFSTDDALLILLADAQRRLILRHVDAAEGPTPVTDLVGVLLADADATRRQQTVAIRHRQLPTFEDCGVLECDPTGATVTAGPRFEEAIALLRRLDVHHEEIASDDD